MMNRLPNIEGTDATLGTMPNALIMASEKGGLNREELLPIITQRCFRNELVCEIKPALHEGWSGRLLVSNRMRRGAKSVIGCEVPSEVVLGFLFERSPRCLVRYVLGEPRGARVGVS
jgi:hypothetical protein